MRYYVFSGTISVAEPTASLSLVGSGGVAFDSLAAGYWIPEMVPWTTLLTGSVG